ncbi:unnamed protein product, partial [Adineta steineri]
FFLGSTSASTIPISTDRLKQELNTIVSSSKKRSATNSDDEDIIPLNPPSSSIIRPPTKRLPNSNADFSSFAPDNQSVMDRTKIVLKTLRSRRSRGEQVAMTQIVAEEQLRLREQLMRKPKPTNDDQLIQPKKPIAPVKRKANEIDTTVSKKIRTTEKGPKNAFDKLVQEMTETMTHVTLTNTTTANTTTVSSSVSSTNSIIDLTV